MGVDMKVKAIYDSEIGNITRSEKIMWIFLCQKVRLSSTITATGSL